MRRYEEEILGRLLDKYERSRSFLGKNAVNQSFSLDLAKAFPEYADDARVAEIRAIEEAAASLEKQGFVRSKRRKNGLLWAVTLETDNLETVYGFLKRKPKREQNRELQELLRRYLAANPILEAFCTAQLQRIGENKNPEYYKGNMEELEKVLLAISAIPSVSGETFERDFSIRVFGDSKTFGGIRGTVEAILFEYGDFPEKETVLQDLNIVRNPGHVYFKGSGVLSISGQVLDLGQLSGDIAISSAMLKDVEQIQVTGRRVVTVENLTTFNAYVPEDELVIYLGGYHNYARREFIKRVHQQNPAAEYYHYGDIDAGGFYILLHLREKTGVHFLPFHMDVETLENNLRYTKKLTENDARRLRKLAEGEPGKEFGEVVRYMLEHDCKLEQEALDGGFLPGTMGHSSVH